MHAMHHGADHTLGLSCLKEVFQHTYYSPTRVIALTLAFEIRKDALRG